MIVISVTALGNIMTKIETGGCPRNTSPLFQYQFRLVWTWQTPQTDWQDRDEPEDVASLINTALILQEAELHKQAEAIYDAVGETRLFKLYDHVMEGIEIRQIPGPEQSKDVILAALLAYRALSLPELAFVAGLEFDISPESIGEEYGLFLVVRNQAVHLAHRSVKRYLKTIFHPIEVERGHAAILRRSMDGISRLKANIYDLRDDAGLEDLAPPDWDPLVPIRYSCVHWGNHLMEQFNQDKAWKFLKDNFLRWVECLSLLESVSAGIQ